MSDNRLDNLFIQLKKLVDVIEKDIMKEIADMEIGNLTIAEISIMDAIGLNSEKTIKEIAEQLNVAVSTPTKTMDRLVRKEYIIRKTSAEDRRMVVSSLTDKGHMALLKINQLRHDKISEVTGKLTDEDIDHLSKVINRLI